MGFHSPEFNCWIILKPVNWALKIIHPLNASKNVKAVLFFLRDSYSYSEKTISKGNVKNLEMISIKDFKYPSSMTLDPQVIP